MDCDSYGVRKQSYPTTSHNFTHTRMGITITTSTDISSDDLQGNKLLELHDSQVIAHLTELELAMTC